MGIVAKHMVHFLVLLGVVVLTLGLEEDIDKALGSDDICSADPQSEACSLSMLQLRGNRAMSGEEVSTGICVSGTDSGCFMISGKWTGSQCCLSGNYECTSGTESDCFMISGKWTGKKCCVESSYSGNSYGSYSGSYSGHGGTQCVDGTQSGCFMMTPSGKWTGSKCCVPRTYSCVSGDASSCFMMNPTGKWTGSLCCME